MKKLTLTLFMTGLIFSSLPSNAGTILGDNQGDEIVFLYELINGAANGTYIGGHGGPSDEQGNDFGFLGMIRDITGPNALGGGLADGGYTTCASIPASGSHSMTDSDGTFTMTFATPVKTIPTGYTGAGGNFDKRVEVAFDGVNFMQIEFSCDTTVGWMVFAEPDAVSVTNSRHIEVYYDTTTVGSYRLELAMYYDQAVGADEYFLAKFQTTSADEFEFWITRSEDSGTDNGFRVAAHGNRATGIVNSFMFYQNGAITDTATAHTDNNDISVTGDLQCIDYSDIANPVDATGSCGSLAISNPGAPIIDSDGNFSIENTGNPAKLKAAMTSL